MTLYQLVFRRVRKLLPDASSEQVRRYARHVYDITIANRSRRDRVRLKRDLETYL